MSIERSHRLGGPATYRIEVEGRLDDSWSSGFDGMTLAVEQGEDGATVTTLTGTVPDQPALHGLLARIRDLGLSLLLVERLCPRGQDETMSAEPTARQWASRVDPLRVRQLYQGDAEGRLDEELLADVGYGIYVRCQALLEVSAAWRDRAKCWQCDNIILRRQGKMVEYTGHGPTLVGGKEEVLKCDQCGWQITWAAYRKSVSGQHLDATGLEDMLQAFVVRWPAMRSPQARLLLIDALIHEFHCWDDNTVGSPVGATLIRATAEKVLALLDDLAYGPASTRGLQQTQQRWAARLETKKIQRPLSELQAIACELGIVGRSRMRRAELQAAIERIAPERLRRTTE